MRLRDSEPMLTGCLCPLPAESESFLGIFKGKGQLFKVNLATVVLVNLTEHLLKRRIVHHYPELGNPNLQLLKGYRPAVISIQFIEEFCSPHSLRLHVFDYFLEGMFFGNRAFVTIAVWVVPAIPFVLCWRTLRNPAPLCTFFTQPPQAWFLRSETSNGLLLELLLLVGPPFQTV